MIYNCTWNLDDEEKNSSCILTSKVFVYQNKKLFRAQLRIDIVPVPNPNYNPQYEHENLYLMVRGGASVPPKHINQTTGELVFLSYHHEQMNCRIEEVTFICGTVSDPWNYRIKMLEKKTNNDKKLQVFSFENLPMHPSSVTFYVKVSSAVSNFGLTFADSTWTQQLWAAAVDKVLTDVEFIIAGESISAHRSLLSARCPVFAGMFASGMEEARTGQVRIDDVDPGSFRHFLRFIYTGTLLHSADKAEIFAVADKYQEETLMDLCRPSTQPVDIDEITAAFLSCWRQS